MPNDNYRRSSTERDLAITLFQAEGTKEQIFKRLFSKINKKEITNIRTYKKYIKDLEEDYKEQRYQLEVLYEKLFCLIEFAGFEANGILDQIINNYNRESNEYSKLNITSIINNIGNENLRSQIQNMLDSFLKQYDTFFTKMVDSYEFLSGLGEGLRQDELLYAIGSNSQINLLTKEGYGALLKQGKDAFRLSFNDSGKVSGIQISKGGVTTLQNTFKTFTEQQQKDILDQIMNKTVYQNQEQGVKVTYKDLWRELRKTDILSGSQRMDEQGQLTNLSLDMGRKFEILISNASSFAFEGNTKTDIINSFIEKAKNLGAETLLSENKSGLAQGDTLLSIGGKRVSIQDKISQNAKGWNGIGANSIEDGFHFYGTSIFKVFDYMTQNPTNAQMASFLDTEFYATAESQLQEQIYTEVESLWASEMSSDSNFQNWLVQA